MCSIRRSESAHHRTVLIGMTGKPRRASMPLNQRLPSAFPPAITPRLGSWLRLGSRGLLPRLSLNSRLLRRRIVVLPIDLPARSVLLTLHLLRPPESTSRRSPGARSEPACAYSAAGSPPVPPPHLGRNRRTPVVHTRELRPVPRNLEKAHTRISIGRLVRCR